MENRFEKKAGSSALSALTVVVIDVNAASFGDEALVDGDCAVRALLAALKKGLLGEMIPACGEVAIGVCMSWAGGKYEFDPVSRGLGVRDRLRLGLSTAVAATDVGCGGSVTSDSHQLSVLFAGAEEAGTNSPSRSMPLVVAGFGELGLAGALNIHD